MYSDCFAVDGITIGIWATDAAVTRCCRCEKVPVNPNAITDLCKTQMLEYFAGKRETFDFSMDPDGTDFQKAVWQALKTIPFGHRRTYGDIAKMVGNPKASRAVGGAVGKNPILIAVPCHRVVAQNGLGGFSAGMDLKLKLLELERIK